MGMAEEGVTSETLGIFPGNFNQLGWRWAAWAQLAGYWDKLG